ncbi:MAG: 1-acyl-sn-glycerol-3-phosphate acyltransferase [Gemmatimonadetes bacterium]|nr:1-acyl-sn-glycerol-3-phosphate acyltransferase [Gemmatimonadota bacterium]
MLATLRACLVALNLVISTTVFGGIVLLSALFRLKDHPGSPYAWCPKYWGLTHLWVGGVRVVEHDAERKQGAQHIFVANHLSNFDVFALAAKLPWIKFVAKAEVFRVPLLGPAMSRAGMIPVERANRKSAFASYAEASDRIKRGASVGVYPEGTRGNAYPLRPFKKGPFVLAIQMQAPVVPVFVYGALERQVKGEFKVYPGTIHMHYLPAIPTAGLGYEDRDELARKAYESMAECLQREYGIASPPFRGS